MGYGLRPEIGPPQSVRLSDGLGVWLRNERFVMVYRVEDRGLIMRLFKDERDARSFPNAHSPMKYGCGWIAMNDAGRWVDAGGVLPPTWQPMLEMMARHETPNV